jgi:hypothetical protein
MKLRESQTVIEILSDRVLMNPSRGQEAIRSAKEPIHDTSEHLPLLINQGTTICANRPDQICHKPNIPTRSSAIGAKKARHPLCGPT